MAYVGSKRTQTMQPGLVSAASRRASMNTNNHKTGNRFLCSSSNSLKHSLLGRGQ